MIGIFKKNKFEMKMCLRKLIFILGCVFMQQICHAQMGYIAGKVVDENKDVVQGAEIAVLGSFDRKFAATTDEEGNYTLKPIPPGTYSLLFKIKRHRNVVVRDIQVIADQGRTANVKLRKGSNSKTDTIKWTPPLIDTTKKMVTIGRPAYNGRINVVLTKGRRTATNIFVALYYYDNDTLRIWQKEKLSTEGACLFEDLKPGHFQIRVTKGNSDDIILTQDIDLSFRNFKEVKIELPR